PLPELVGYCESLQFDTELMREYFRGKLAGYDLNQYGIIVLGCTHYPFYRSILRQVLPPHIQIVDGNVGTIKRLTALMNRFGIAERHGNGSVRFMCTGGEEAYLDKMRSALNFYQEQYMTTEL
ncbi:glutamate racemase, partial [Paenibacillus sp. MCAF20]